MEFEYQLKEAEEYGFRKGYRRGYRKGYREGYRIGFEEGLKEVQCNSAQKMIAKGYSDEKILSIADRLTVDDLRTMRKRS